VRTDTLFGPRGLWLRAMVPESRRERMRGLIGRASLDPHEALLLERTRSIHTFGMRFPIAVALLDRHGTVRHVRLLLPHRVLLPRPGIRGVLELHEDADARPGDRMTTTGASKQNRGLRRDPV
jgi:uncharacterized membrane protein (UPF0127 family)